MAQNPPGPRADRHRRALGDFCAGRTARPHHRGRGARAHLQAGGSAALPCARRGHHARADGKCRRRARLGHAVAGKFLQLPDAENTRCSNCPSAWTIKKCRVVRVVDMRQAARKGKGQSDFFAATQGGHSPASGSQRADDFISEPARLLDFAAMPEMRLRCAMPELQRLAHVSSAGAKTRLPHLRPY